MYRFVSSKEWKLKNVDIESSRTSMDLYRLIESLKSDWHGAWVEFGGDIEVYDGLYIYIRPLTDLWLDIQYEDVVIY